MKRTHRTAADWQTLITAWQASGLSAPRFCEQQGINQRGQTLILQPETELFFKLQGDERKK